MKQNILRATMFKIIVKSHRRLKNCDFYVHGCRHFVELFVIEEHESCIILHLSQLRVFCFSPLGLPSPTDLRYFAYECT
jgi:hypothetical protein